MWLRESFRKRQTQAVAQCPRAVISSSGFTPKPIVAHDSDQTQYENDSTTWKFRMDGQNVELWYTYLKRIGSALGQVRIGGRHTRMHIH